MKPPEFSYVRPTTVDGAVDLLSEWGPDARALAGGQSLVPLLNFRLARPTVLVDLNFIDSLQGIEVTDRGVRIGAMVRQRILERHEIVNRGAPLIRLALENVGHIQNRNRGTFGGSIAHADPAAELPAVLVAFGAGLTARSPHGERLIDAADFFTGPFTTCLGSDELLTHAEIAIDPTDRASFHEVSRRHGDFAIAGVAALRRGPDVRLAAFGVGLTPVRLHAAEAALAEGALADADHFATEQAVVAARAEVTPIGDIHGSADYRHHLVGVLVRRALRDLEE